MMYAAAGQFFCYCIITICIRYNEDTSLSQATNQQWAKASIAFFFLYYVFFGIGWQGVPWVRSPRHYFEIFCLPRSAVSDRDQFYGNAHKRRCFGNGNKLVSTNTSDCTISTHQVPRIFNFMVVEITPPGIRTLHWRFYIIWCVFNFTFIPIGKPPPLLSKSSTSINNYSLSLLPRDRRPHARRPGPLLRRRRPTACFQGQRGNFLEAAIEVCRE
jgi:hypothetical protein